MKKVDVFLRQNEIHTDHEIFFGERIEQLNVITKEPKDYVEKTDQPDNNYLFG